MQEREGPPNFAHFGRISLRSSFFILDDGANRTVADSCVSKTPAPPRRLLMSFLLRRRFYRGDVAVSAMDSLHSRRVFDAHQSPQSQQVLWVRLQRWSMREALGGAYVYASRYRYRKVLHEGPRGTPTILFSRLLWGPPVLTPHYIFCGLRNLVAELERDGKLARSDH